MPHPYRRAPRPERAETEMTSAARWDDRILGLVMLVLAAPRVVLAFATHECFGAEATIASVAVALGLLLLLLTPSRSR